MTPPQYYLDRPCRLVVVDPQIGDYRCLIEPAREQLVRLTLTTTGRNALRLATVFPDSLWLISPQLPDMDGLGLLEMLHSLRNDLKAVVIDSVYDEARERRALELRAMQYVCKPLHTTWLSAWQGKTAGPIPQGNQPIPHVNRPRVRPLETRSVSDFSI